jgi:hypothetical protein
VCAQVVAGVCFVERSASPRPHFAVGGTLHRIRLPARKQVINLLVVSRLIKRQTPPHRCPRRERNDITCRLTQHHFAPNTITNRREEMKRSRFLYDFESFSLQIICKLRHEIFRRVFWVKKTSF